MELSSVQSRRRLGRAFYRRPAEALAPDLIGKVLVRRFEGRTFRARILETEAYVGPHDLACHAAKGRTARTEIMFGRPGFAYVYLIYGMYDMLNIVASTVGDPQAVLIRAARPIGFEADLGGPGKLCRALHITTRRDNGLDLTQGPLFLLDDGAPPPPIRITPRIGIDYARHWKDAPLRFVAVEADP